MSAPSFAPVPQPSDPSYRRAPWLDTHPEITQGYTAEHRACPNIMGDLDCTVLRFPVTDALPRQASVKDVDEVLTELRDWLSLRTPSHHSSAAWAVRPNSILTAVETDSDGFFTGMEGGAIAKHRFTKDLESLMKKYWDAGVPFLERNIHLHCALKASGL